VAVLALWRPSASPPPMAFKLGRWCYTMDSQFGIFCGDLLLADISFATIVLRHKKIFFATIALRTCIIVSHRT
jgi:hypothetical protein